MNQLQPKVLLIEDDYEAAMSLCKKLKDRYGFDIKTLSHGKNILGYLDQDYDVIVSDMYLPYLDGILLCQKIREHSDIPIIMISAEHHSALYKKTIKNNDTYQENQKVRVNAFGAGIDDFISKPFHPSELAARVYSVLRRCDKTIDPQTEKLDIGKYDFYQTEDNQNAWHLDTLSMKLIANDGASVALTTSDLDILKIFLMYPEEILDREFLVNKLKKRSHSAEDRTIDVRVGILRKKLNDPKHQLIKTIHHKGYVLAAKVKSSICKPAINPKVLSSYAT